MAEAVAVVAEVAEAAEQPEIHLQVMQGGLLDVPAEKERAGRVAWSQVGAPIAASQ